MFSEVFNDEQYLYLVKTDKNRIQLRVKKVENMYKIQISSGYFINIKYLYI